MKAALAGMLLWALASTASAQGDALQGLPSVSAERARIEDTRKRESAQFDAQEAACYDRFAVNDCLRKVQTQRRAVMAELKRQETVLNDAERMQRGAAQIRASEEKAAEKREKDRDAALIDSDAERAARQKAQDDKRRDHAEIPQNAGSAPRAANPSAAPDSAAARATFESKQEEARKHRLEAEKRLKDKAATKPAKPLKPLPVPP